MKLVNIIITVIIMTNTLESAFFYLSKWLDVLLNSFGIYDNSNDNNNNAILYVLLLLSNLMYKVFYSPLLLLLLQT